MASSRLFTIEEAAVHLNVSKTSLRRWTNLGLLPCVRVGARRERRFTQEELDRFADRDPGQQAGASASATPLGGATQVLEEAAARGVVRHVALMFRDRDEWWRLLRPYALEHRRRGAPIVFIHEAGARGDIEAKLREEGWDPERMYEAGLLRMVDHSEAHLRTGSFSAERMLDFVEAAILDLRSAGHETLLMSGEMSWYLKGAPGSEGLCDYECRLNELMARYPQVTIVCTYDVSRLGGTVTLWALCSHPHVQLSDRLVPGYYTAAGAKPAAAAS